MKGMEQRNSSIEIYRSPEGNIELNVKLENDTVLAYTKPMAELFAVDRTSVTRHIRNIYKSQELDEKSTCAKNAQVHFIKCKYKNTIISYRFYNPVRLFLTQFLRFAYACIFSIASRFSSSVLAALAA